MKIQDWLKLLRIKQWYKNIVIFTPLLYLPINQTVPISKFFLGFIGLCLISSASYIINDILDRKQDALHPIKKFRPFAAKKIQPITGIIIALGLIFLFIIISKYLNVKFFIFGISYFILTNFYSLGLKNIPILDSIMISTNFILRLNSIMINPFTAKNISFSILIFGIITILLSHKRRSDIKILKEKAIKHKPVLKYYTKTLCYSLITIGYAMVLISFFTLHKQFHIIEIISFLIMLSITSLLLSKHEELAIKPYKLFKTPLWISSLLIVIAVFYLIQK